MTLTVEFNSSLAGRTLSIEANVIRVIDCLPSLDSGISISTEELRAALKVSVNVVLFRRIEGVLMLKDASVRRLVTVSRDCSNAELILSAEELLLLVTVVLLVSLAFIKSHDSFASSMVRTPVVTRIS